MFVLINFAGGPLRGRNLEAVIEEADVFRTRYDEYPRFAALDKRLHTYWEDFYQKLIAIK